MFNLSFMESEKTANGMNHKRVTLEKLAKTLCVCKKDAKKNGSGFVRGELLTDENGCILERCDENLEYSKLLIIDGDSGIDGKPTPTVDECIEALTRMEYNYILYTTHSHKAEHHKYRVVIEMTDKIEKHELRINMEQLLEEFKAQGVIFNPVKEMFAWSQIWFNPRRADPSDGLFRYSVQFNGSEFQAIHTGEVGEVAEESEDSDVKEHKLGSKTLRDLCEDIRTGNILHPSLLTLSYQLIKEGVSKPITIAILNSMLDGSMTSDQTRLNDRYNEVEKMVNGAIKRVEEESKQDFEITKKESDALKYVQPPLPPGRLGKFITETVSNMARPEIEIAFSMVLGSLGAICGAHYNLFSNRWTGLNTYIALIAKTGSGKDQISEFVNMLFAQGFNGRVTNISNTSGAISFLGASTYTGPKSLINDLPNGRSKLWCMTEAAYILGSSAGSPTDLLRLFLELYTKSDVNGYLGAKKYSSDNESTKAIYSPCLSLLMESTPDVWRKVLANMNAIDIGLGPRISFFQVLKPTPINCDADDIRDEWIYSEDVIDRLNLLLREACHSQVCIKVNPVKLYLTKEQRSSYLKIYNNFLNIDYKSEIEAAFQTRIAHKMLKYAGLCYLFNTYNPDDCIVVDTKNHYMIDDESWEWAKKMGEWEAQMMPFNLSYILEDDDYSIPMKYLKDRMIASLEHKNLSDDQKKRKMLTMSILRAKLSIDKNNECKGRIKSFAAERKMDIGTYLDMVLKNMEKQGMIKIHDSHQLFRKGSGKVIELLEGINHIL